MSDDLSQSLAKNRPRYDAYMPQLRELIEKILSNESIITQSVTARVKSHESALAKAARPEQSITSADEMHDLLGVRVITYFADQVDAVARVFRDHFDVDESRTKDRRDSIDPDRFGYLSMHLSLRLNDERRALVEWQPFEDIWAEVQIRSSLQHSWAEIEHDLGYKSSSGSIPAPFRRRFSRLAGLLELADDEFMALRDDLSSYGADVAAKLESGGDAPLDQASLHAFVLTNSTLDEVDRAIVSETGAPVLRDASKRYSGWRATELRKLGYTSTKDVERRLTLRKEVLPKIASAWLRTPKPGDDLDEQKNRDELGRWVKPLSAGIGLFYLYLDHLADAGEAGLSNSSFDAATARLFLEVRAREEHLLYGAEEEPAR